MTLATQSSSGLPAVPAPALFLGRVVHRRLRPVHHRFTYRVVSLLLDIDRLAETTDGLRLLSLNRVNLFSFYLGDHGPRDGSPLRPWVAERLALAGIDDDGGPVRLLCFPRMLGYVFNPISLYYCYRRDGRLAAMLYEVSNTFGERHTYAFPLDAATAADRPSNHGCAKALYVSPFIGMTADYRFRIDCPGERLSLLIRQSEPEGPCLLASLAADRRPLSDAALARAALGRPLSSWKVIAAIHFEALRLWAKGVPIHRRQKRATGGSVVLGNEPSEMRHDLG